MDNYFLERDKKNIEKIRKLCDELPAFCKEFFVGIQLRTSSLTRLNYAYDLRIFFDYLSRQVFKSIAAEEIVLHDLEKLTAFDIELFLEYLSSYRFQGKSYACGTQAKERKLSTLRSFFKYYFKKDKISANVTSKVDSPKIKDSPIVRLEPNEVSMLLDEVETGALLNAKQRSAHEKTKLRDIAIMTLFLGTGIRISELVGLNRNDIDLASNCFTVTRKGGNKSQLYFSDEVAESLKLYYGWLEKFDRTNAENQVLTSSPDALFVSLKGDRLTVRAIENLVKKFASLTCPLKKITPHKLRSTYGTALYRETQDIYIVADVLGHKDVNTTKKHYAAISEDMRRNAAKKVILRDKDTDEM